MVALQGGGGKAAPTRTESRGQGQEGAGAGGGDGGGGVEGGEEEEADGDGEMLSSPAEGSGHGELHDRSEDGESGLRATHDVFGNDGHKRRLSDYAREGAEETKGSLQGNGANQKRDEGHGNVAEGHAGHGRDI